MPFLQNDFIDAALSYRLESSEWLPALALIDALMRDKPELKAERRQVAGGWMMYGGPHSPMNHIIGMGLQGPVSREEFDEVEDFYRRHNSVCEVVVSPYADMSLLGHLGERGYRITEWNSVLVRRLDPTDRFDLRGVDVRPVDSANGRQWCEVMARGFADLAAVSPDLFTTFTTSPNGACFLAYVDGQPAGGGAASVFPEQGIAPFHGAATLPEFRNRGVQNALFQARLQAVTAAGGTFAVVCTQPGTVSQRNAERNGFRVAYTKVAMQRHF